MYDIITQTIKVAKLRQLGFIKQSYDVQPALYTNTRDALFNSQKDANIIDLKDKPYSVAKLKPSTASTVKPVAQPKIQKSAPLNAPGVTPIKTDSGSLITPGAVEKKITKPSQ